MKHILLLMFAIVSIASSAQTYMYHSEDSLYTLCYDAQQQRIKVHSPEDYFMMVHTDAGPGQLNTITPAFMHNTLMQNQRVYVIALWNDGKEERDIYFEPRTYRDAFTDLSVFDGKFLRYMKTIPRTITLTLPLETKMVEVTFVK